MSGFALIVFSPVYENFTDSAKIRLYLKSGKS